MNAGTYTPESSFGLGSLFAGLQLSKAAPEPFWRQLYLQIAGLIHTGAIKEGGHLPSERDLAQALGVSRVTVKRCYDELRNAQQLAGKGRAGSVVQAVPRVQPSLGKLKGFTQEMQELGMTASTQLLEREVITDRMMASVFGRPSTAQFLRLVRVRRADDAPMTREVAWYDLSAAPSLAQWDALGSAYGFIKDQCGVVLGHAEQTIEAVMSSPAEAQTFSFEQAQPCLLFKRKTYSQQMQLIEYVEGTFRGDAYVYKLKLEA
jgi:GntR family transcriptional regulator